MSGTVTTETGGHAAPVSLVPSDEEIIERGRRVVDGYLVENRGGSERLIPLLHRVQEDIGYLPFPIQEYIAARLAISPIQVYSVVSFYHFFTTVPRGRFQLKVCMGTACFVQHAEGLLDTIKELTGLRVGEVTADRIFSLEQVRCIGACGLAPAMMVNDEVYGHLTPAEIRKLLRRLKSRAKQAAGEEAAHA
ncbi:MAG: NAD(P)H-dependent oxidoreductase subunit E [Acidobacteriota bacterium]